MINIDITNELVWSDINLHTLNDFSIILKKSFNLLTITHKLKNSVLATGNLLHPHLIIYAIEEIQQYEKKYSGVNYSNMKKIPSWDIDYDSFIQLLFDNIKMDDRIFILTDRCFSENINCVFDISFKYMYHFMLHIYPLFSEKIDFINEGDYIFYSPNNPKIAIIDERGKYIPMTTIE
jgi:hypothetical protein